VNPTYRVNSPSVASEIIDGEAVIMHLGSGQYFSTQDVGGVIWGMIEEGRPLDEMLDALGARYDAEPAAIAAALDGFLRELERHELIAPAEPGPSRNGTSVAPASRQPFAAPVLNVYTDMQDLLLLDPIHDVGQAGWPVPKDVGLADREETPTGA
jgi:hypothetical protein